MVGQRRDAEIDGYGLGRFGVQKADGRGGRGGIEILVLELVTPLLRALGFRGCFATFGVCFAGWRAIDQVFGAADQSEGGAADLGTIGDGVERVAEALGLVEALAAGEGEQVLGAERLPGGGVVLELGGFEERGELGGCEIEVGGDGGGIVMVQAPDVEERGGGWERGGHLGVG